jgi:hypothetical protein
MRKPLIRDANSKGRQLNFQAFMKVAAKTNVKIGRICALLTTLLRRGEFYLERLGTDNSALCITAHDDICTPWIKLVKIHLI